MFSPYTWDGKVNKVSVNISIAASGQGLKDTLAKEARNRGATLSRLVAAIYKYAVYNKKKFAEPLKDARVKPGEHISATVSEDVRDNLNRWAEQGDMHRAHLCCFILEKALEDNLLKEALHKAGPSARPSCDGDDPDDRDDKDVN